MCVYVCMYVCMCVYVCVYVPNIVARCCTNTHKSDTHTHRHFIMHLHAPSGTICVKASGISTVWTLPNPHCSMLPSLPSGQYSKGSIFHTLIGA
jgi:hypothetical protein